MQINNYLSPLEFEVTIKRLPNVEFFTQRVSIPGISATAAQLPTPFNISHVTPDKLNYDQLQLQFIIDEKMENYMEVFSWIEGITFPQNGQQYKNIRDSEDGLYSDISILIRNSKKRASIVVDFVHCMPIALSDVQLDITASDLIYPEATVTFQYDSFSLKPYNS